MIDLVTYLPVKRRVTASGWISFNAVCCQYQGHKSDRRARGGLKAQDQDWTYHCFNCQFTASFVLGRPLSFRARTLLSWLGVPHNEIEKINFESLKHRSIFGIIDARAQARSSVDFQPRELPPEAELVTPDHEPQWSYLRQRAVPEDFPVLSVIDHRRHSWRPNVIVPFTWQNTVVGYTARLLDDRRPKYLTVSQPGYVFGIDNQQPRQTVIIVVEGCFDALSIGGCAVLHNDISDVQAELIKSLGRRVIFVPDLDPTGLAVVDRALELGWSVSMPEWPEHIKDVNDAVIKYSRLGALYNILQNSDSSRIRIELKKKRLLKKLTTKAVQ